MLQRLLLALSLSMAVAGAVLAPASTSAATWAPAATAAIHPGVQTYTEGSQCTSNFIFTDGVNTYIGQAAHCSTTGGNTSTNGCTTASLPIGTPVTILGAAHPGVLAYNSWLAMQAAHETDASACAYNDLALVKIDPADVATVNPSIPVWGGPVGVNTAGTQFGDRVYSYGNSILRLGVTALSPKEGISEGDSGNGWTHTVEVASPGVPGDSGSAFLDAAGNALGDLSTISVGVPSGVVNNVSDLDHELAWLHAHQAGTSLANVQVVTGTAAFNANAVPVDTTRPVDDPVGGLQNFLGI